MTDLPLATARAKLLLELNGKGATPRTAARRISDSLLANINDPDCAQFVRVSTDPALKGRTTLAAAAILNSNDIAASVSGEDRTALAELIDNDTRELALTARPIALPATGAKGADCAANIRASVEDVEAAWRHMSPFSSKSEAPPADITRLEAATELALAHLDVSDG